MTGSMVNRNTRLGPARWAVVPAILALFALVGLALSTEDRSEFQSRQVSATSPTGPGQAEPGDPGATGTAPADETPPPAAGGNPTGAPAPAMPQGGPAGTTPPDNGSGPGEGAFGFGGGEGGGVDVNAEISSPAGRVGLELGGTAPVARPVGADGTLGIPSNLAATPGTATENGAGADTAGAGGFRLTPDGRLEPVDLGAIAPGDLVITAAGNAVDLLRADGSRVELRPSAQEDGAELSVVEVATDGTRRPLSTGGATEIPVGDRLVIRLPGLGDLTEPDVAATGSDQLRRLLVPVAVVAALALAALGVWLARRRRAEPFGPGWVGTSAIPPHRFEELLGLLAADSDPARAIRLAFAAAERGFGTLPRRVSTETPFEWYRRVSVEQPALAEHLAGLCAAFANTRFTPHPPTAADRDTALADLRRLHHLAHNPDATPPAGPGPDRDRDLLGVGGRG